MQNEGLIFVFKNRNNIPSFCLTFSLDDKKYNKNSEPKHWKEFLLNQTKRFQNFEKFCEIITNRKQIRT
jgi:hypothetical protein